MAPHSPNQKRKRGTVADLSLGGSDASRRATRGRNTDRGVEPAVDDAPVEQSVVAKDNGNGKSNRKGGSKKDGAEIATTGKDASSDGVRRSKRDRRSADDNPWWMSGSGAQEQEEAAVDNSAPPKKRARISQDVVETERDRPKARSGRTTGQISPERTGTTKSPRHTKAKGSSSGETVAQAEAVAKRRGRPRKSDIPAPGIEEQPVEETPEHRRRGRPRLPNVSVTRQPPTKKAGAATPRAKEEAVTDHQRTSTTVRRRISTAGMDDELEASLPPVPPYRHIEPRTRQVPRSIIKAKWTSLDRASIDAVAMMLSDASRPVLMRLRDQEQGQHILRLFASRLQSKLRKGMPFPPAATGLVGSKGATADAGGGHVEELTFESIVDSIESLETILDPLLHSVALLEKEKAREEASLEEAYEALRSLESNARKEAKGWRERQKKSHALAPEPLRQDAVPENTNIDGEGLALSKHKTSVLAGLVHDTNDDGLLSISQQTASHMESIQRNLQPIQTILPSIRKSRAALQAVLQTNLTPQQLEKVLLG